MRVAVVGGDMKYLRELRGALVERIVSLGHDALVVGPGDDCPSGDAESARALRDMGAHVATMNFTRRGTSPRESLQCIRALRSVFKQHRVDTVLASSPKIIAVAMPAARLAGARRCFPLMTGLGAAFTAGATLPTHVRLALRLMLRGAFEVSDTVIFQNPDDRQDLQRARVLPKRKPTALVDGSGVDAERFRSVPLPDDRPRFLFVGRIVAEKGIREYVDAAKRVRESIPSARFEAVGPVEEGHCPYDSVAEFERSCALAGVNYVGPMRDIRSAVARANVFVLPSYREGTPRSVLEAMAMGRPIITTDAPGCRQTVRTVRMPPGSHVLDGPNGELVPARQRDGLVEAMHRFASDPSLRADAGMRSRRLCETVFDVHRVNARMMSILGLDTDTGGRRHEKAERSLPEAQRLDASNEKVASA